LSAAPAGAAARPAAINAAIRRTPQDMASS
jgi:hypothetical protein